MGTVGQRGDGMQVDTGFGDATVAQAVADAPVAQAPATAPAPAATERATELGRRRLTLGAAALAAAVVVLWAGYTHRWPWTGLNGHTATLWDWLHLMLLPVVVVVLPVWLSRRVRLARVHKTAGLSALGAFAVLVAVGYVVPWGWTGFSGNTLWDWLNLLALPVAVALAPLVVEWRETWSPRHSAVATAGLAAFLVVVLGGYLGHWKWTGFTGNTLWNWLNLFLLPFLLPAVVAPAVKAIATTGLVEVETVAEEVRDVAADGREAARPIPVGTARDAPSGNP